MLLNFYREVTWLTGFPNSQEDMHKVFDASTLEKFQLRWLGCSLFQKIKADAEEVFAAEETFFNTGRCHGWKSSVIHFSVISYWEVISTTTEIKKYHQPSFHKPPHKPPHKTNKQTNTFLLSRCTIGLWLLELFATIRIKAYSKIKCTPQYQYQVLRFKKTSRKVSHLITS
jgi:hypothetical protein